MTPQSSFVVANGLRFHCLRWGGGGKNGPLLLNHATGFLAALWQPVAARLAGAGYEVLAYDARGHGDSDRPEANEANYHWQRFVDDLQAIVGALGLRSSPFVGHSMGGACGLHLEGSGHGTFSSLAVIEPIIMPGGFQTDEARRTHMAESARRRRMTFPSREEMIEQYRSRAAFARWTDQCLGLYAASGTFETEDRRIQLKCPAEVEGEVFSLSGSLDTWELLPSIEVPVLVMAGRHTDGFLDMVAQGVSQRVQNGRYVQLPDAGHLAPMEYPDLVADEILHFLAR